MENLKAQNIEIEGSALLGRGLAAAGDIRVGGDLHVKRDVKIEGWLDAPNLLNPAKGLYATVEELEECHRDPRPGSWALVGESLPAQLYVAHGRRWCNTGTLTGTPQVARMGGDTPTAAIATCECRAELDKLDLRVDEAETSADEAYDLARAAGVLPFDGFNPMRGGARPNKGVWYMPPDEEADVAGSFWVMSSDYGLGQDDYTDVAEMGPDGSHPARTDRLYRCGHKLYCFDGRDLVQLSAAPYVAATVDEILQKIADRDVDAGRFYCTVDPSTRIVTSLYLP